MSEDRKASKLLISYSKVISSTSKSVYTLVVFNLLLA